jgi:hypothetical protein
MLRQLLALLALIAGLSALPASAEVRHGPHSGGLVEVAATENSVVRAGIADSAESASVKSSAQPDRARIIAPADVLALPRSVEIGIDRAHE